ncbi:MAG: hypothetical protein AABX07_01300 [Nanoarchaeota archaeon]
MLICILDGIQEPEVLGETMRLLQIAAFKPWWHIVFLIFLSVMDNCITCSSLRCSSPDRKLRTKCATSYAVFCIHTKN